MGMVRFIGDQLRADLGGKQDHAVRIVAMAEGEMNTATGRRRNIATRDLHGSIHLLRPMQTNIMAFSKLRRRTARLAQLRWIAMDGHVQVGRIGGYIAHAHIVAESRSMQGETFMTTPRRVRVLAARRVMHIAKPQEGWKYTKCVDGTSGVIPLGVSATMVESHK